MEKYKELLVKLQAMLDMAQPNKKVDKYNLAALMTMENDLYDYLTSIKYHSKYGEKL